MSPWSTCSHPSQSSQSHHVDSLSAGWEIWRRRSHVIAKHLLSDLRAINSVLLSITSQFVWSRFRQMEDLDHMSPRNTCSSTSVIPIAHVLSIALSARFEQSGNEDDLMNSIKCLNETGCLLPLDHPQRATALASTLLRLCEFRPQHESRGLTCKAFVLFEEAANHSFASAKVRFQAAVQWLR